MEPMVPQFKVMTFSVAVASIMTSSRVVPTQPAHDAGKVARVTNGAFGH